LNLTARTNRRRKRQGLVSDFFDPPFPEDSGVAGLTGAGGAPPAESALPGAFPELPGASPE